MFKEATSFSDPLFEPYSVTVTSNLAVSEFFTTKRFYVKNKFMLLT